RFVTEFGPLLYGNHQWTIRRLEFECPRLPFLGALGRRLRCRDPLFRVLTGDGHARPFRSSEIFRLHVVVEPEMPAGPKQKDLFDFLFQTRRLLAEKVDSQRALTCVCDARVDGHHRILARLNRPVELSKIHKNIALKSAIPDTRRAGWALVVDQGPPQLIGEFDLPGSDEAIQILTALPISKQFVAISPAEYGSGF